MAKGNYLSLYFHIVFSTKNRTLLLYPEMQSKLYAYIQRCNVEGIASTITVNGMRDHIHLLVAVYSGEFTLSNYVRELKKSTNKFINNNFGFNGAFGWQPGYYASTVSEKNLEDAKRYIQQQKEHHHGVDFYTEMGYLFGK